MQPGDGMPQRARLDEHRHPNNTMVWCARSASTGAPITGRPVDYTGHFSSFQAISQNIHSYRELMTNESSMRRFSSSPAVLAH